MYHPISGTWYGLPPFPDGCVDVANEQLAMDCQRLGGSVQADGSLFWPPAALDRLRAEAKFTLTCARDEARLTATVDYAGHSYQVDPESQANITSVVVSCGAGIPLPAGFVWRTADNKSVPMSAADMIALGALALGKVNSIYAQSFSLKAQIEAAPDAASILNVSWVLQ